MAKVAGPLLSLRANGSVYGMLTYSEKPGGTVLGKKGITPPHKSAGADEAKENFADAARLWDALTDEQKALYNHMATFEEKWMSGRCLFFKNYLDGLL